MEKMRRYTDIEPTPKRLPPVCGYLVYPLLPLDIALEPILSKIDQLSRFSKIAKTECHFPSEHGLTHDESAAVFLYTMEWGDNSFYRVINSALRAEDRSTLTPWFAYLKLFDTAMQKLPTVRNILWRGITVNVSKNFKKGDKFTWWPINSCSTSTAVVKNFLGSNSTLFLINAIKGKDVSNYTSYQNEDEVILCPGTRLRVVSDPLDKPPMYLVHLEEMTDDSDKEQPSTPLKIMTVTHPSRAESSRRTVNVQPSPTVKSHTDKWGDRYEGEMIDGTRHGKGKMEYANGDIYIGVWVKGNMTGQGIFLFANGDCNEGQWRDNKMHGKGKMDFANGDKYVGDWIEDSRTGQGVYIFADGSRYEGQFKDNKQHGPGKMVWGSKSQWAGDIYTGDWIQNNRTGYGVYMNKTGGREEGYWKDNRLDGKGTKSFENGDRYTGNFLDGAISGFGVYVWSSGNCYEGQWKNNQKHGRGKMKHVSGRVQDGMWSNDKFIS